MRSFSIDQIPKATLNFHLPTGPVDLEIGAGQGLHAIRYSQQNPERTLFAVERTHTRFAKLERRKQNHPDLHNLHVIHADAISFVSHYLSANSLDRIFLLYPNPYPKAKQSNLRWHNMPFLGHLLSCLKTGGTLTLATNDSTYANEAADRMVHTWKMDLESFRPSTTPRTHFEKKYLDRGEACWNLIFCKPSNKTVQ